MPPVAREDLLSGLPPEWPQDVLPEIRRRLAADPRVVIVLDDDPTGTQTVHDVPVVTVWDVDVLTQAVREAETLLYVLTNSRALHGPQAAALATRLGALAAEAGRAAGREVVVGIRGDSTLRGHFPVENLALAKALAIEYGRPSRSTLIVPFFGEGGRITVHGVHYVAEGDHFTPAGETEFARDATFGYQASYLPEWVGEKSAGQYRAADVMVVDLDTLRRGGPQAVFQQLNAVPGGRVVVADSASYRDVEVLVLGLLMAEEAGKRFLYRTAAAFYRARGGLSAHPLVGAAELLPDTPPGPGGLIVVGSHVQRTSQQLEKLLRLPAIQARELVVADVLDPARRDATVTEAAAWIDATLGSDPASDAVLFTSRAHVQGAGPQESLRLAAVVSDALVAIVKQVRRRPRFIIAKGGITSSDLGTRALGVRIARVPGQVAPGVPVWTLGEETPFPGLPYVVFPGNVGTADTLAEVVLRLRGG